MNTNIKYFKYEYYSTCNSSCPDGYYEQITTLTCEKCDIGCATCGISGDDCLKCMNYTGIVYYYSINIINNNNECITSCNNG